MTDDVAARVLREKQSYQRGLQRAGYNRVFSHAKHHTRVHRLRLSHEALQGRAIHRVLEIGRQMFPDYLEGDGILPEEVYCINISEKELATGAKRAEGLRLKPHFVVMDAHALDFPANHFDLVCGLGVLHHLDLDVALEEIARVLRPGGVFMFSEPLDNNPVGRVVRRLTPSARTEDERPLRHEHLAMIQRLFDCEFHYEQAFAVPAGIASALLLRGPDNRLMRAAHRIDAAVLRSLPQVGPMFRGVTIIGTPRA